MYNNKNVSACLIVYARYKVLQYKRKPVTSTGIHCKINLWLYVISCGSGGDTVTFLSNHAVKQMAVEL